MFHCLCAFFNECKKYKKWKIKCNFLDYWFFKSRRCKRDKELAFELEIKIKKLDTICPICKTKNYLIEQLYNGFCKACGEQIAKSTSSR